MSNNKTLREELLEVVSDREGHESMVVQEIIDVFESRLSEVVGVDRIDSNAMKVDDRLEVYGYNKKRQEVLENISKLLQ